MHAPSRARHHVHARQARSCVRPYRYVRAQSLLLPCRSSAVQVAVSAPPTVAVISPAANVTLTAPVSRYYVGVNATDPDGYVASVTVFANGVPIPGSNVYGALFDTNNTGTYVFTATATDSAGVSTTSAAGPGVMTVLPYVAPAAWSGGGSSGNVSSSSSSGGGCLGNNVVLTVQNGTGSGTYPNYT